MAPPLRRTSCWCLALAAALAVTACTCKKGGGPDTGPTAAPTAGPSEAWLAGRLPPEAKEGTPKDGGTLVIRVAVEPAGLTRFHDQLVEGTMVRYTSATCYESLGRIDRAAPDGPLQPALAESWEESADHLTLTVKLRKGVAFHDGSPFSSRDVKAAFDVIRNEKNMTAAVRSYFADVTAVETPDPHTVVVKWKKPYVLAARNILTAVPMMPAAALAGEFDTLPIHRAPIGTGPFKFEKWEQGKSISFVRNEAYWGPRPHLDKVVVRIVKDETVAAQLWERGEFDLMTRISPTQWRSIETAAPANEWAFTGYHRIAYFENVYSYIGWNEKRPFFADPEVRRALAMLYPAETVSRTIDLGLEPPTTCPYYQASTSCDPAVEPLSHDPDAARALLDKAGWVDSNGDGVRDKDGVPFKFTFLSTPYSLKMGKLLPVLQEELRKVGVEMDIEKIDGSVYIGRVRNHDFDAASLSWSSSDALVDNFQIFHSTQAKGGSNYVSYSNPKVDQLLEQIRTEFDPRARAAHERQVHRLLYDDQVYLFLSLRPALDAVKTRVRGLEPSIAWYDLTKVWLEK